MPYRTQDNRIDGVVITFVDITAGKNLEEALRETESILRGRFLKQTTELDTAKALEEVLRQAQTVLESRLTARTSELKEAREHERPGSGDSKQDAANP
jgi:two-component system CheB/CheR fusion protein